MRALSGLLLLALLSVALDTRADTDCILGQRYLSLAHDRIAAGTTDEAVTFLHHAVEVCPGYDAYEQLGELQSQSPEREDQSQAVKAFVSAIEVAPTDQARARGLYQYAALLSRNGDPQNAYPFAKSAHSLDPSNAEVTALAQRLEEQIRHPSRDQLVRGLQDELFEPLRIARQPAGGGSPSGSAQASSPSAASPVVTTVSAVSAQQPTAGTPPLPSATGPAVQIQINFDTGTTEVDSRTWPNITLLAHALADPSFAGRKFVFIGHADLRGTDEYNLVLSQQRAAAMYRNVVLLEPTLKGRVEIIGHGSREPIELGTDAEALRANRRLQVLLK
jgi:outer membrane protein OmpA-like peptidoglycan-associated protein